MGFRVCGLGLLGLWGLGFRVLELWFSHVREFGSGIWVLRPLGKRLRALRLVV